MKNRYKVNKVSKTEASSKSRFVSKMIHDQVKNRFKDVLVTLPDAFLGFPGPRKY